ncbi:MAG: antibiotic biosynthesis monooxygenase [Actinomycetota bacterium]|nr:antibiotic biosynthesis monooxygenase [Actinomycetota bacterium]
MPSSSAGATDAPVSFLSVSFPVAAGMDADLHAWLAATAVSARSADGFLGLTVDSVPARGGGTDWRLTYRFASGGARDAWRASPARAQLVADAGPLFAAPPVESQTEELDDARRSMVISEWIPAERVDDWRAVQAELNAAVAARAGFAGIKVFEPPTEDGVWTTIITFASDADLRAWQESDQRKRLVALEDGFATSQVRVQPAGRDLWFDTGASSAATPTWKKAMTVLAVLYPLVTAYNITLGSWFGRGLSIGGETVVDGLGIPFPAVVFIGNVIGTILLTWVLMPFVTRVMSWWLDPLAAKDETIRGVMILIGVYAVTVAVTVTIYMGWGF